MCSNGERIRVPTEYGHFPCVLCSRWLSAVAIIHSHFASEEAQVLGEEVPSSGLTTGCRACHSTLFSPLQGPDHLLTCCGLSLCRRPWVFVCVCVCVCMYMVAKVQPWSSRGSQSPHTFLDNPLSLMLLLCALGTSRF